MAVPLAANLASLALPTAQALAVPLAVPLAVAGNTKALLTNPANISEPVNTSPFQSVKFDVTHNTLGVSDDILVGLPQGDEGSAQKPCQRLCLTLELASPKLPEYSHIPF